MEIQTPGFLSYVMTNLRVIGARLDSILLVPIYTSLTSIPSGRQVGVMNVEMYIITVQVSNLGDQATTMQLPTLLRLVVAHVQTVYVFRSVIRVPGSTMELVKHVMLHAGNPILH